MTFKKVTQLGYIALSTDVKSTDGVVFGAKLLETDSGRSYVYDGTSWINFDPVNIPWSHHRIHMGKTFYISHLFEAVADDANADIILTVGAVELHMIFSIAAEGSSHGFLTEGPDFSVGSTLTPRNADRDEGDGGAPTAVHTPTVTDVQAVLIEEYIPGGSGGNASGGAAEWEREWNLLPTEDYLFRVTNKSGGTADISIIIQAYEFP